ncbi:MAG: sulfite reductase subunit alpha [Beijerinckiaceae bacterium]|nr:sulfite reductase subunit alpha [Beijerinckiaceae bacterium]
MSLEGQALTQRTPVLAPVIPDNAPFSAEQRAWLSGFLAGLMSLDAPAAVPLTALENSALMPPSAPKGPLDDGDDGEAPWKDQSLPLEERMALAADRPLRRRMMAAMAQQDCGQCGYNCEDYSNAIVLQAEERLNLCVPGGKATARMLKSLIEEMGGGATDPDEQAAKDAAKPKLSSDTTPGRSRAHPVEAVFVSRRRLNKGASEKVTNHIEIDLTASGLDYVVGDSLGVYPKNDPELADAIIAAIHAPPDFPIGNSTLREVLINDVSLGLAPDNLFQFFSYLVGGERRQKAIALGKGQDPDGDAAHLDVLAAVEKFSGIRPDPEAFVESLEPLQPRLYSISSSIKANPGRVALTIDTVRYTLLDRERRGVASTYFADRLEPSSGVRVYVQPAHDFALPADPATPIIMVGPGTGIAPFRAFLQERMATAAPGGAWLFFGHQRRETDFFYEDELAAMQEAGALSKLSLAWSRDGERKVYVQDKMREEAAELWAWLERGAHFYICGDAKRMAADVETALIDIAAFEGGMNLDAAKAFVKSLKTAGRYQADVY